MLSSSRLLLNGYIYGGPADFGAQSRVLFDKTMGNVEQIKGILPVRGTHQLYHVFSCWLQNQFSILVSISIPTNQGTSW